MILVQNMVWSQYLCTDHPSKLATPQTSKKAIVMDQKEDSLNFFVLELK